MIIDNDDDDDDDNDDDRQGGERLSLLCHSVWLKRQHECGDHHTLKITTLPDLVPTLVLSMVDGYLTGPVRVRVLIFACSSRAASLMARLIAVALAAANTVTGTFSTCSNHAARMKRIPKLTAQDRVELHAPSEV